MVKYGDILEQPGKGFLGCLVYVARIKLAFYFSIIYTTNAVESYHRMVRKFTKSKAVFPTDDSIRKVIYMSVVEISKKWTMPIRDWELAYSQFAIFFEDRFAA